MLPLILVLVPLVFIAMCLALIVALIIGWRRRNPRLVTAAPALDMEIRLAQDGFWLESCPADPGSLILFHYWSGGVRHASRVPYSPDSAGRQFIYTGRTPEQVVIARIDEFVEGMDSGIPPLIIMEDGGSVSVGGGVGGPDWPEPPPSVSQFPPAY